MPREVSCRNRDAWLFFGAAIGVGLLFWLVPSLIILIFSGVLAGIFLWAVADWLARRTRLGHGVARAVVVIGFISALAVAGWLLAPELASQAQALGEELTRAWKHLQARIKEQPWGPKVFDMLPGGQEGSAQTASAVRTASGFLSSTFGAVANLVVIFIVGIYLAADPGRYAGGLVRLLPAPKRPRAREIFDALGATLRHWLVGRFILMAGNAVVTALGLWLLGVPLPITLGIIAGLLNFIPNLGPIIAAIPAVLLAFLQGPSTALYVILLYTAYQMLDGYVFTPLVDRQTVCLPPAVTILSQVLLGLLWGFVGVLLAAPLAACGLVLVRMIYLEDILGEKT